METFFACIDLKPSGDKGNEVLCQKREDPGPPLIKSGMFYPDLLVSGVLRVVFALSALLFLGKAV